MFSLPPPTTPAYYIPYYALAFTDGESSVAVGPDMPLPIATIFPSSGATPLAGGTSSSMLAGPFKPEPDRPVWLTLAGAWAGTVRVTRSVDGGATTHPLTAGGLPWGVFTANACEPVAVEYESNAAYYLDIALVSGTLAYRVAQ